MSEHLGEYEDGFEQMSDAEIDRLIEDESTPEPVREVLLMALVNRAVAESFTGIIEEGA